MKTTFLPVLLSVVFVGCAKQQAAIFVPEPALTVKSVDTLAVTDSLTDWKLQDSTVFFQLHIDGASSPLCAASIKSYYARTEAGDAYAVSRFEIYYADHAAFTVPMLAEMHVLFATGQSTPAGSEKWHYDITVPAGTIYFESRTRIPLSDDGNVVDAVRFDTKNYHY